MTHRIRQTSKRGRQDSITEGRVKPKIWEQKGTHNKRKRLKKMKRKSRCKENKEKRKGKGKKGSKNNEKRQEGR